MWYLFASQWGQAFQALRPSLSNLLMVIQIQALISNMKICQSTMRRAYRLSSPSFKHTVTLQTPPHLSLRKSQLLWWQQSLLGFLLQILALKQIQWARRKQRMFQKHQLVVLVHQSCPYLQAHQTHHVQVKRRLLISSSPTNWVRVTLTLPSRWWHNFE